MRARLGSAISRRNSFQPWPFRATRSGRAAGARTARFPLLPLPPIPLSLHPPGTHLAVAHGPVLRLMLALGSGGGGGGVQRLHTKLLTNSSSYSVNTENTSTLNTLSHCTPIHKSLGDSKPFFSTSTPLNRCSYAVAQVQKGSQ